MCGQRFAFSIDGESVAPGDTVDPQIDCGGEGAAETQPGDFSATEDQSVEPAPKLGFFGAIGWCLVLVVAQAFVVILLGIAFFLCGALQLLRDNRGLMLVALMAIGHLVMVAIGWNNLQPNAARKLAMRRLSLFHVLIVALLVLPVVVLSEEIGNRAEDAIVYAAANIQSLSATAMPAITGSPAAYTGLFDEHFDAIALQPWAVMFLVGCILPGVCEEVFFRGFLGRGLLARYGMVGGVTLTSLIFGCSHIDPVQVCYTCFLGIVLHVVYLSTRSLWGPIALHIVFNAVGFSLRKLGLEGTVLFGGPSEQLWIPVWLTAATIAASLALIYLLYKTRICFQLPNQASTVWSPNYATAAMPPVSLETTVRRNAVGVIPLGIAGGSWLAFALCLIFAASVWFDPAGAWSHVQRGMQKSDLGNYEAAIDAYTKAIEADPTLPVAYCGRGEANRMLGNLEEALDDQQQAIRLEPTYVWAHAERGETLRLMERWDEAMAACQRAIELDPRVAWVYTVRGAVHSDNGDSRQAIADFRTSIRLDPQNAWTHFALAWELVHCEDDEIRDAAEAIRYAEKACELADWSDAYMLATLAAAYAEDGQFVQAIRYQRKALKLAIDDEKFDFQLQLDSYEAGFKPSDDFSSC